MFILLITGDRRIRVHTLCLPVSDQLAQLYAGLNILPITGVLAKMGIDRLSTASLGDARDVSNIIVYWVGGGGGGVFVGTEINLIRMGIA